MTDCTPFLRSPLRIGLIAAIALLLPAVAAAGTVLRAGETVSVTAEQVVSGDFYGAAGQVDLSGSVDGDTLAAGGQVRHHGTTSADLHLAGGQVTLLGNVGDDARLIGGEVVVDGAVAGDLVVLGGQVSVLSNATVGGDLLILGGQVDVRGTVGGNVLGFSEMLRLNGAVAGSVDVTVAALTLGDRARIDGDVRYRSARELVRAQNAEVAGAVSRSQPPAPSGIDSRVLIIPVLVLLFAALSAFLLLRGQLQAVVLQVGAHPLRVALIGFAVLFLTPIVCVVLLASVLGSLLGLALLLTYLLMLLAALIGSGAVLGGFLARLLGFAPEPTALSVALGTLLCYVAFLVPYAGPLLAMIALALTIGALAELIFRALR